MENTRRAWRPAAATAIGAIASILTLTQYNPAKGTQGGSYSPSRPSGAERASVTLTWGGESK
jgi:hypothetical protein